MRWLSTLATLVGLLVGAHGVVADEVSLDDFYGHWRGVEAAAEGAQGVAPADLNLTVRPEGDGFRMRWTTQGSSSGEVAGQRQIEVGFEPTGQPGVFAYRDEPGSLFDRLFASPATSNPLEGETLLWARLVGPTLTVYSLVITREGAFRLDRDERTLHNGSMSYVGTRRTGRGPILSIEGRLEPEQG
jgi:hypothetical protein